MMLTSRTPSWPLVAPLLAALALGCGGGQQTKSSGSGGSTPSTSSALGGSVAGSSKTSATGSLAGGGASATSTSLRGGSAGGASLAGSSGSAGTTGGTGGGAGGGSGGTPGTGGTSMRDAGADVAQDASPDVPDRPADAASLPGTHNPALTGVFADPHIIAFEDTFYIYPTTDGVADWGATSFSAFSSKNLVQWTNHGVILNVGKDLSWAKGRAWAPAIARVDGTYFFYFSAETQIGVATSTSPTGPFKDALGRPLVKTGQYGAQSIDPYAFIDDDGTKYLYFGSGGGGLRVAKLNADMISFANTPSNISPSGASGTLEGVGLVKRKGVYYLYWSEGDTRNATYRMAYARASSALGPFTRLATILEQNPTLGILGPGGGTILGIPSRDEFYVAYHRFKIPGGDGVNRETCIDRLIFNADGSMAPVKPTLEGLQAAVEP